MELVLTCEQLTILHADLVSHPPERLVHVVGRNLTQDVILATALVLDEAAETSGTHCRPSPDAEHQIQVLERQSGDRYIGIIHTHPQAHPHPSAADASAAHDTLAANPHLPGFFVGVITHRDCPPGGPMTPLGDGHLVIEYAHPQPPRRLHPALWTLELPKHAFAQSLRARLPRAHADFIGAPRVVVIGAGSVGSTVAEILVRNGVGTIDIVDPDVVEAVNLSRTVFTTADLGKPKVEALAARLRAINPLVEVTPVIAALGDDTVDLVATIVQQADLVVAATDDPRAQAIIDHLIHEHDTAGLFAGVYAGGHTGEVVIVVPGLTTCFRCAAGNRRLAAVELPATDYSTGRLNGAVALGSDVTAIAVLAAKTALELLGLIHEVDDSLSAVLLDGRTMVQIGLSAQSFDGYGVFTATPNQHGVQSVWMHPEPSLGCGNCPAGDTDVMVGPSDPVIAPKGPWQGWRACWSFVNRRRASWTSFRISRAAARVENPPRPLDSCERMVAPVHRHERSIAVPEQVSSQETSPYPDRVAIHCRYCGGQHDTAALVRACWSSRNRPSAPDWSAAGLPGSGSALSDDQWAAMADESRLSGAAGDPYPQKGSRSSQTLDPPELTTRDPEHLYNRERFRRESARTHDLYDPPPSYEAPDPDYESRTPDYEDPEPDYEDPYSSDDSSDWESE